MRRVVLCPLVLLAACPSGGSENETASGVRFTVSVSVTGGGRVVSDPAGLDCAGDCDAGFPENASVTLTARPDPSHELVGWGGECEGSQSTCVLTATEDLAVTATFREVIITPCDPSVTFDPGGSNGFGLVAMVGPNKLDEPTDIAFVPGTDGFLVAGQKGRVSWFDGGCDPVNTVDVAPLLGVIESETEEGLMNIELHPDFPTNHQIFFYFTSQASTVNSVARMTASFDIDGKLVLADPVRVIDFHKSAPAGNHNGGGLVFAPDGTMLASVGDGGTSDNGQKTNNLLGVVVRIDPNLQSMEDYDYAIPAGNMFPASNPRCYDTASSASACPEILAYGLRNPWRMSLDGDTVILANVGTDYEEIDTFALGRSATNFGWPTHEGYTSTPVVSDYVDPILAYDRYDVTAQRFRAEDPACNGCATGFASVTTGDVYRGSRYDGALYGRLLHSEFMDAFLRGLALDAAGQPTDDGIHLVHHDGIAAMVTGPDDYVYVVTQRGDWGTTGAHMVYRLVKP